MSTGFPGFPFRSAITGSDIPEKGPQDNKGQVGKKQQVQAKAQIATKIVHCREIIFQVVNFPAHQHIAVFKAQKPGSEILFLPHQLGKMDFRIRESDKIEGSVVYP